MEMFGFLLWILIGLLFGLMGAGGSVLTLPILVYLFRIDVSTAALYSLFIVGSTSILSALVYIRRGLFDIKSAVDFGVPSIIAVVITKIGIDPILPDVFFTVAGVEITKEMFLMCLLSAVMFTSSARMIRTKTDRDDTDKDDKSVRNPLMLRINGLIVGVLSGLVGVGGGFLIIPALIFFCKLDIKQAIGTSLTIIAIQCIFGFLSGYRSYNIDWSLIVPISLVAIFGALLGLVLSTKIEAGNLKRGFGWFIGLTAVCIIVQETVLKIV